MLEIPTLVEPLFRAAGWQGAKIEALTDVHNVSAHAIASSIIDAFPRLTSTGENIGGNRPTSWVLL
ncbi:hypothetical protein GCM10011396_25560 [Undibacterium terreum]|uniref:Uncharacterized protein n=1 Tax=Undibacterium terreum TaxID=1224302 RepID=A0A916XKG8_9BURK|nr:hypothetical protein GCM10011396_25560 [Undibacterium terreum]